MARQAIIALCWLPLGAMAQCTNYQITVGGGWDDASIFWQLYQVGGGIAASGSAPVTQTVCLPDGCYYMNMYDDIGDGWSGATYTIKVLPSLTTVASGTLPNGFGDIAQVSLGTGCLPGCSLYQFGVSAGSAPSQVSWSLVSNGVTFADGGASSSEFLCLDSGCYVLNMFDSGGNGWNGATWTLLDGLNGPIGNGTLDSGSSGSQVFAFGVPASQCGGLGPMSPADCETAMMICGNTTFPITANGYGTTYEVPALGASGNPNYAISDGSQSTWGTDNWGCLRVNEHNSTWMIISILAGGSLEFTMGAGGAQTDFYDWIMYPYNASACGAIMNNTLAPVRCNWNDAPNGGTGIVSTLPPGGDANNYEPPLNVLAGQQYVICFSNYGGVTANVPLVFGGSAIVGCSIPLPVELISFTARPEDMRVHLDWVTATEHNTSHFELERSTDVQTWSLLQVIPAAGNSVHAQHYASIDEAPFLGMNYYRLRIVDTDGSFEYSDIASALIDRTSLAVWPNPSDGVFWVNGTNAIVHDVTGRIVPFDILVQANEAMQVQLTTPGIYQVSCGIDEQRRTVPVVVR